MLADINTNEHSPGVGHGSYPAYFTVIGNQVWFSADHRQTAYNPLNTFGNYHPSPNNLICDPWITDGTPAGTRQVLDIENNGLLFRSQLDHPQNFTELGGKVFFTAGHKFQRSGTDISEITLFQSDGTEAGTSIVSPGYFWQKDTVTPEVTVQTGKLLMNGSRYDRETELPQLVAGASDLWQSDGTDGGTVLLKQIGIFPSSSNPKLGYNFQEFLVYEDEAGSGLTISDGTAPGTFDFPGGGVRPLAVAGDRLIFLKSIAGPITFRNEVHTTNGTEEGTEALMPGLDVVFNMPVFFPFGDRALFTMEDEGNFDHELWITEGTPGSNRKLTYDPNRIRQITVGSPSLVLFTLDGNSQLWKSDGTVDGTELLHDAESGSVANLTIIRPDLILFTSGGSDSLWRTDGTVDGTSLVVAESFFVTGPGNYDHEIRSIEKLGDEAVVFLSNGFYTYFWITDGTADGTQAVPDSIRFPSTNEYAVLGVTGDKMFFTLDTQMFDSSMLEGNTGYEPWGL